MHIKVRIAIQLRLGPLLTSSNLSAELEGTLTPSSPRLSEGHRRASPSAQRAGAASKRHARQWSPSVSAADTTIEVLQIQGFKSYRDETVVDPFSAGLNLLVGRNGSGKSNFFSAIRFVLSDAYTSLSREERQALLHDSGGAGGGATMSAFVEIEFDNADGRFPTNKPSLLLRRTIGLKKDEYQLDRKSTSKGEVMSLLESAGFSRSNPYYIVPQGRITHLTNQKDADRLLLLKEVAGTKVYEERRAESTKIMDETNAKRDKIKDLLEYIQARLDELEEEKEELKQYQTHDRARRSLEYCIYQRELKDVGDMLDQIEEGRNKDIDEANSRREEFNQREKELSTIRRRLSTLREELSALQTEHDELSEERREVTKARTQVDCLVRDAEDASRSLATRRADVVAELEKIEASIADKETELANSARPDFEAKKQEQEKAHAELEELQVTLGGLYARQGRRGQFRSKQERDQHLQGLIDRQEEALEARRSREEALVQERDETEKERQEVEARRVELRKELDGQKGKLKEYLDELKRLNEENAEQSEHRKELWKKSSKLDAQTQHAMETLKAAQRTVSTTMDRDTANGLCAAREIAEELALDGYFGPLYELFEVDDRYKTAVEVTAGTSLFQIVVDTDDTATKILDRMVRDKRGRVTFMPLNRLRVYDVEINKLKFSEQFRPAFKQVFGRTVVCQTLEIAGAYTRSHGLNAITLDGDKYDRKGALTGGFHDVRRSRLDAVKALKAAQRREGELSAERAEVRQAIAQTDQEVTTRLGQTKVIEGRLRRLQDEQQPLVDAIIRAQEDEDRLKSKLARLDAQLTSHRADVRSLEKECEMWRKEMESAFQDSEGLSDEEEEEMKRLSAEADQRKKALVELSKEASDVSGPKTDHQSARQWLTFRSVPEQLERAKDLLEIELNENLRRRREELRARLDTLDTSGGQDDQNATGGEDLEARKKELKKLDKQIHEVEQETERVNKEIVEAEKERETHESQQTADQRNIDKQGKSVERYLAKRQLLLHRKDECNQKIRDLGVLPEEAFAETTAATEKLLKKLRKVNEALKAFAHVNKKAFEQYSSFTKQRDELIARQEELDESQKSILELIDVLDARKDEAIERTFKQVAKNFAEVFEKLVPSGRGRLIMLKRQQEKGEDDMDVDEPEEEGSVENYTGVAIRVSFKSKSNEGLRLQQLSGGQKALVALALIFSIQKCDPAPFYLFDEIDANLDADRRTAVAAMISELSEEAQYICTTFRAELIPHADAFFGVVFNQAKISNVKTLTADECSQFIVRAVPSYPAANGALTCFFLPFSQEAAEQVRA
ncbi:Structural maintenance of chromosomes protein 3 [Rhodotorula mucilaginosa]|uniref:Structural maintenance of chromosomes protein n=1 Tax=Rhodotorula mucilaginosa TaxID=5537 RepID=A0A9P6VXK3_RHOMI|nr:Structural maintenance of chromosomes protein 3 [Rhodotorula mucilaginosa]